MLLKKLFIRNCPKLCLLKFGTKYQSLEVKAAQSHPNATFPRIFCILGLKIQNLILVKIKYRMFVHGSNMKDINNEHVFFNDTSSAPTNMVCISVIAYGQITNSGTTQADAEQAFIQPLLPNDEYIYIYIYIYIYTYIFPKTLSVVIRIYSLPFVVF